MFCLLSVIEMARKRLVPGGLLALEVGDAQGKSVGCALQKAGFGEIEMTKDLYQVPRVISAFWGPVSK